MREVLLPVLGESVVEATVTRWMKSVGDQVSLDEPILEVSTDKVDTEVPSPVAGVISEIFVKEGETVPNGTVLCLIQDVQSASSVESPSPRAASPALQSPPAPTVEKVLEIPVEHIPQVVVPTAAETAPAHQEAPDSTETLDKRSEEKASPISTASYRPLSTFEQNQTLSGVEHHDTGFMMLRVSLPSSDPMAHLVYHLCSAADSSLGVQRARTVSLISEHRGRSVSVPLKGVGDLRPEATSSMLNTARNTDPTSLSPQDLLPSFIGVSQDRSGAVFSVSPLYGHAVVVVVSPQAEILSGGVVCMDSNLSVRYDEARISLAEVSRLAGELVSRLKSR